MAGSFKKKFLNWIEKRQQDNVPDTKNLYYMQNYINMNSEGLDSIEDDVLTNLIAVAVEISWATHKDYDGVDLLIKLIETLP